MIVFDYLFRKILGLRIYNSSYWARLGITIFQAFLILPVFILLSKYFFGCDAFVSKDTPLKIVFAISR